MRRTGKAPSDDTCTFAVLVTFGPSNYRHLLFVQASSLHDAYVKVVNGDLATAFQTPQVSLEGFVVGQEQLRDAVPDVKAVAQAYWNSANRADSTFEDVWTEHGPGLVDE